MLFFLEEQKFECAWNLYSGDRWIVKDRQDLRVIREEEIVHARAEEGTVDALADTSEIGKILCMCSPEKICSIEEAVKKAFPELSVAKSSDTLLEIMPGGVTKRSAVIEACKLWKIPIEETVAFGDHYNDVEMLETVALPFLMGNAPQELKERFHNITDSNDEDGIYHGLMRAGLLAD